jgi:hypothetical protein
MRNLPLSLITLIAALALPGVGFAKNINLYDAPQDNAKLTGTADLSAGIIPIYTPPNSTWVKIADPRNGNTGWVRSSELTDKNGKAITFSQQISDNNNGSTTQSMQMNVGSQPLTPAQQAQLQQQLKLKQQEAAQAFMTLMEETKKAYQQTLDVLQAGLPAAMPGKPQPTQPTMVPRTTTGTPVANPAIPGTTTTQ